MIRQVLVRLLFLCGSAIGLARSKPDAPGYSGWVAVDPPLVGHGTHYLRVESSLLHEAFISVQRATLLFDEQELPAAASFATAALQTVPSGRRHLQLRTSFALVLNVTEDDNGKPLRVLVHYRLNNRSELHQIASPPSVFDFYRSFAGIDLSAHSSIAPLSIVILLL